MAAALLRIYPRADSRCMSSHVQVNITNGTLLGKYVGGVAGFLGVPYAIAPVGEALRFRSPLPHANWTGVRDATKPPPLCVQSLAGDESEDCLYLNAFLPAAALTKPHSLPVLVHIHGGAFQTGSADTFWDFVRLTGMLVVSIQYRLGVLGFWGGTNLGLADQQLALRWVQEK